MSENSQDRLDRIEVLVEKIGQRVDSNARAIQALTENDTEAKKERARLYQIMSDLAQSHATLAQSHATLAQAQADNKKLLYSFMEHTEQRQEELKQRQDQLEEQQQRLIQTQADIAELLKFVITNKT